MSRLRLLHVIGTLDPAYGGPVEAIRETTWEQSRQGHAVEILTLDAPGDPWIDRVHVPVTALGPSYGKFGFNPRLCGWLRAHREDYDAVVVNGIWEHAGLGAWRALRNGPTPFFIYAHGQLDPWFARFRLKHLKKAIYWKVWNHKVFRDAAGVLFLCDEERRVAENAFHPYQCKSLVVSHGTARPERGEEQSGGEFLDRFPTLRGRTILLFLGRIHAKKGVDVLIRAWARIADRWPEVQLVIAGAATDGLVADLHHLSVDLGVEDRITWTGFLDSKQRFGVMHAADAFILPSHGENFGLAVVEALARRLPVLISKRINIWREIVAAGAGFAVNDDVAETSKMMEEWLSLNPEEKLQCRANAYRCFEERFEVERMTSQFVEILRLNGVGNRAAAGCPELAA